MDNNVPSSPEHGSGEPVIDAKLAADMQEMAAVRSFQSLSPDELGDFADKVRIARTITDTQTRIAALTELFRSVGFSMPEPGQGHEGMTIAAITAHLQLVSREAGRIGKTIWPGTNEQ